MVSKPIEVVVVQEFQPPSWLDRTCWNKAVSDNAARGVKIFDTERYYLLDYDELTLVLSVASGLYSYFLAAQTQRLRDNISQFSLFQGLPIIGVACIVETLDHKIVCGVRSDQVAQDRGCLDLVSSGGLTGDFRIGDSVDAEAAASQEVQEEVRMCDGSVLSVEFELDYVGLSYSFAQHCSNPTLLFKTQLPYYSWDLSPSHEHSQLVFLDKRLPAIPRIIRPFLEVL